MKDTAILTARASALSPVERGRLGGLATARRHGSVHMEAIGRDGFWTTVKRHWNGNAAAYLEAQRRRPRRGERDSQLRCRVARGAVSPDLEGLG